MVAAKRKRHNRTICGGCALHEKCALVMRRPRITFLTVCLVLACWQCHALADAQEWRLSLSGMGNVMNVHVKDTGADGSSFGAGGRIRGAFGINRLGRGRCHIDTFGGT